MDENIEKKFNKARIKLVSFVLISELLIITIIVAIFLNYYEPPNYSLTTVSEETCVLEEASESSDTVESEITEEDIDYIIIVIVICCIDCILGVKIVKEYLNAKKEVKENGIKTKKIIMVFVVILFLMLPILSYLIVERYFIPSSVDKPIIYLYPEEETEVSVELGYPENITVSYPTYVSGWKVLANTDGTLIDLFTGKELYALYYESKAKVKYEITNEGFCIKSEDTTEFLEEKLLELGLTEREAEEFIIYWLPILQENEYNYIRFVTQEEIEENMPLIITPTPDTLIRVLMIYKGLDNPIEVEEQIIETPERTGFVAVEWGGSEIK